MGGPAEAQDSDCRHVSLQAESLQVVEERLQAGGIPFVKQTVTEDGLRVHQVPPPPPPGVLSYIPRYSAPTLAWSPAIFLYRSIAPMSCQSP